MTVRPSLVLGAALLVAGFTLGACSSDDHGSMDTATTTTAAIPDDAEFNATDVAFAQGMIPHHAQAIEMADMALERSEDPQLLELATAIKAAQQPEIDQLTAWLESWGQPVPDTSMGAEHSMHGMEDMMMEGMMSAADMERLGGATGADFDRLWLEMMILHHAGAVSMAQDEISGGEYPGATAMAEVIVATQEDEINRMDAMLAALAA